MSYYQAWQLQQYGDVLTDCTDTPADECFESGIEELNRLAEWTNNQAELNLLNENF